MSVVDVIEHVNQAPDTPTCMSACLAMITGVPYKEIVDRYQQAYFDREMNLDAILGELGVKAVMGRSAIDYTVHWGNLYLAGMPSLSRAATLHAVVIDARDGETVKVYDPQRGNPGCPYYFYGADAPKYELIDGIKMNLGDFVIDAIITGDL